jgi:hypothetical protein
MATLGLMARELWIIGTRLINGEKLDQRPRAIRRPG